MKMPLLFYSHEKPRRLHKETLKFDKINPEKRKFYSSKELMVIKDVYIECTATSSKYFFDKNCFNYFVS